jgi:hypothetical protein
LVMVTTQKPPSLREASQKLPGWAWHWEPQRVRSLVLPGSAPMNHSIAWTSIPSFSNPFDRLDVDFHFNIHFKNEDSRWLFKKNKTALLSRSCQCDPGNSQRKAAPRRRPTPPGDLNLYRWVPSTVNRQSTDNQSTVIRPTAQAVTHHEPARRFAAQEPLAFWEPGLKVVGEPNRSATLIWRKQVLLGEWRGGIRSFGHPGPFRPGQAASSVVPLPWYIDHESRCGADAPAILIQNTNRHGRVNILGEIHGS